MKIELIELCGLATAVESFGNRDSVIKRVLQSGILHDCSGESQKETRDIPAIHSECTYGFGEQDINVLASHGGFWKDSILPHIVSFVKVTDPIPLFKDRRTVGPTSITTVPDGAEHKVKYLRLSYSNYRAMAHLFADSKDRQGDKEWQELMRFVSRLPLAGELILDGVSLPDVE